MKLNKKMTIPAFALLAAASLVGSISGTIAWYQYSTRANVSYIGASAGTYGNLQVRLAGGEWGTQIRTQDVLDYLETNSIGQNPEPVTPGALGKNSALKAKVWNEGSDIANGENLPDPASAADGDLFLKVVVDDSDPENIITTRTLYKFVDDGEHDPAWQADNSIPLVENNPANPDLFGVDYQFINYSTFKLHGKKVGDEQFYLNPSFGVGAYKNWTKASLEKHYVKIPLQLRFVGKDEADLEAQDVYLSKLLIQEDRHNDDEEAHGDISDAIRVHFSAYKEGDELHAVNHLVSKKGGTTATHGRLKLGRGSDDFDKAFSEGDDWGFNETEYKYVEYGEGVQNSYGAVIAEDPNETYYDDDHNYYERDEIPAGADGWEEIAASKIFAISEDAPGLNNGTKGKYYIQRTNVGAQNEGRQLYIKEAGQWEEITTVLTGIVDPNTDDSLDTSKYYLKTNDHALYAYDSEDPDPQWKLVNDVLVEDNDDAVAEEYAIGKLRINSEDDKLYRRIPGEWTLVASELLDEAPEIAAEGDFVVGNKYIDPDTDKLYEYVGGIYVEKVSPILVSEKVNPDNPLEIGDTTADKVIGKTIKSRDQGDLNPQKYLNVDVTIWVEGWQKFNRGGKLTSIWEKDLIDAMFDVGMQFAVQDRNA